MTYQRPNFILPITILRAKGPLKSELLWNQQLSARTRIGKDYDVKVLAEYSEIQLSTGHKRERTRFDCGRCHGKTKLNQCLPKRN